MKAPTPLEAEVTRTNDALVMFKRNWEAQKAEEFRIRSQALTEPRDRAVLAALAAGSSKAAVARALKGHRTTVYEIIDRAQMYYGEPSNQINTAAQRMHDAPVGSIATDLESGVQHIKAHPWTRHTIEVDYNTLTGVLTLDLHDAVLDGMAAAQNAPVTGIWKFTRTGTTGGWSSAVKGRKGPFDYQIAAWLNAAPEDVNGDPNPLYDNVLRQALTDAGIDDIIKSEAQNTDQPQDAGTFELTI